MAAHNAAIKEAFDGAEEFSNWMPDDGKYTVSVLKRKHGTWLRKDEVVPVFWWRLSVRIEAGDGGAESIGKEFSMGPYNTDAMGILKGQVRALNPDKSVSGEAEEIHKIFGEAVGKVLAIEVATNTGKNGKDYRNCYIQEVVQVEDVDVSTDGPPQGGAAASEAETGEVLA